MEVTRPGGRGGPIRPAAAAGSFWGLATYGILWEGTPVEVSRAFVEGNPIATLVLLPSRIVIWAILGTETVLGRTFDLSTSYVWLAPASMLVGAAIGAVLAAFAGSVRRRSRGRGGHSPL